MEEFKLKAEALTKSVGEYFDTYYKLTVVKAADKATGVAASSLAGLATFFLGIFVLFFSGMALGIWLGDILENEVLGYLLVALLYLLLSRVVSLLKNEKTLLTGSNSFFISTQLAEICSLFKINNCSRRFRSSTKSSYVWILVLFIKFSNN